VAAISLSKLTKVYATGVKALDALDLDVADGEFVVLVGPSGCGKTTALRMVAGLERITSGTVSFGDRVVNDVSPRYRDVAMVFQNYALYPHLSVYQNIGFALENQKVAKAERDRRIRHAAGILGSQRLDLPAQVAARVAAYQGRKVIVGVRPEDLVVSAGPGLVTEARLVEVLGSEQHVYFWLDATQAAQAQAAAAVADEPAEAGFVVGGAPNGMARIDPHTPVKPGGRVTFTVDPARLYFFDPDTGQAITG
jgi:ABC-type sugar transport system ATPase subunit